MIDRSNGYDALTNVYLQQRGRTGSSTVDTWARSFTPGATVIDMGCGTGIPVTKILVEAGLQVYAVDASPNMIAVVRAHFPGVVVACEAAEQSVFFNRLFDGIIAVGLMFLLAEEDQRLLIRNMGAALMPGGRLLFSAPFQQAEWKDVLTGRVSRSLGREEYNRLMIAAGLTIGEELNDEGGNHYFSGTKLTI